MAGKPKSPPRPEATTIRWNDDDWKLIEALQKEKGLRTVADVVRNALRESAKQAGLR